MVLSRCAIKAVVTALAVSLFPISAHAQNAQGMASLINACSSALVTDKIAKTDNAFTQLALSSMFGQQTADSMGASGGGNYGVISGHGAYNKNDTSNTTAVSSSTYSNEEMSSYVAAKLSGAGAAAYQACLQQTFGNYGLHLNIESYDTDQATIRVKYVPQPGTDTTNMTLKIWSNGTLPGGQDFTVQPSGYDSDIIVNVVNPSKSLRFMVAAVSKGHQVGSIATTLPIIQTTVNDSDQKTLTSATSSTLCGGFHHTQTTAGTTVTIQADKGYALDLGTLTYNHAAIPGDRGGSPNSWYVVDTAGPQKVAAHAECVVPDGNNFFAAAISISANEMMHTTYLQILDDNGKPVTMQLLTP